MTTTLSKNLLKFILSLIIIPMLLLISFYYSYLTQTITNDTIELSKNLLMNKTNHIQSVPHSKSKLGHCLHREDSGNLPPLAIIDKNMRIIADTKIDNIGMQYHRHTEILNGYIQSVLKNKNLNLLHNKEKKIIVKPLLNTSDKIVGFMLSDYSHTLEKKLSLIEQTFIYILLIIVFVTFISIILTIIFSFNITQPIKSLIEGTKRITDGDLSYTIDISSNDEVGMLVESFNNMTKKRKQVEEEIQDLNKNLELKVQSSLHTLNSVIDNVCNLIFYKDTNFNYIGSNKSFEEFMGHTREELIGNNDFDFFPKDLALHFRKLDEKTLNNNKSVVNPQWVTYPNGEKVFLHTTTTPFYDEDDNIIGLVGNAVDITQEKLLSDKLEHQAQYDHLTEIPNRALFMDRLSQSIKKAKRYNSKLAIFFIDLDKFKFINDSLGHHVGDIVLQKVAKLLSDGVRESDTIARLGGDEFAAIISDLTNEEDGVSLAQKLVKIVDKPFIVEGETLHITLSIGVAFYNESISNADDFLKLADSAMYKAKENGKNCFILA